MDSTTRSALKVITNAFLAIMADSDELFRRIAELEAKVAQLQGAALSEEETDG